MITPFHEEKETTVDKFFLAFGSVLRETSSLLGEVMRGRTSVGAQGS